MSINHTNNTIFVYKLAIKQKSKTWHTSVRIYNILTSSSDTLSSSKFKLQFMLYLSFFPPPSPPPPPLPSFLGFVIKSPWVDSTNRFDATAAPFDWPNFKKFPNICFVCIALLFSRSDVGLSNFCLARSKSTFRGIPIFDSRTFSSIVLGLASVYAALPPPILTGDDTTLKLRFKS